MKVTTKYKYPKTGTRNNRLYPAEVLKKAFDKPLFKELCVNKSIPVVEYEHNELIGFATAYLEDDNVTTVDASIFNPTYINILKEFKDVKDNIGFTLAGSGYTEKRDGMTVITDMTFDRAILFVNDLAVDCQTKFYMED